MDRVIDNIHEMGIKFLFFFWKPFSSIISGAVFGYIYLFIYIYMCNASIVLGNYYLFIKYTTSFPHTLFSYTAGEGEHYFLLSVSA